MAARRILLVGQPNVGKSSLLRALTGAQVEVSNYPGTTVDVLVARARIGGVEYEVVDTPGVYNLYPSSVEEEVTERAIIEGGYDAVVNVVDATALERSLLITVALAELGVPMVVAVNFWEEAEKKGIVVDTARLEGLLGVPVVRVNPLRRGGVEELARRLPEARRSRLRVRYDDHIEAAASRAERCLPTGGLRLSRRGLAVRLVEGDPVVCEKYCCPEALEARRRLEEEGHDPHVDVEVTRAGVAAWLASQASRLEQATPPSLSRLDLVLLQRPPLGIAFSLGLLAALILSTVVFGSYVSGLVDSLLSRPVSRLSSSLAARGLPGRVAAASVDALYAQYVAALPYVFIFYLFLTLLEDSGVLARMVIWLSVFTRRLGLHPKIVIPALLGMGCSVPAVFSTRLLPGLGQRLAAAAMTAFIPCSSRSTVIYAIGSAAAPWVPLFIYMQGFLLAALAAALVSRTLRAAEEAVIVEDLPPLRLPHPSNVAAKARAKLEDFVKVVTPLIVAGAVLYALLDYAGVAGLAVRALSPLASLLGLPPAAMPALLLGFIQKDLVVSMLAASLGVQNPAAALTPHQALVFTVASSYQVPCVIALGAMAREFGWRRALLLLAVLDAAGFGLAALYAHLPLP